MTVNPTRPYNYLDLVAALKRRAVRYEGRTVTKKQRQLVALLINDVFGGFGAEIANGRRHDVQKALTGFSSLTKIPDAYILAMLDWLEPQQAANGTYKVHPVAETEIFLVLSGYDASVTPESLFGLGTETNAEEGINEDD